jgi:hypothetical protein
MGRLRTVAFLRLIALGGRLLAIWATPLSG